MNVRKLGFVAALMALGAMSPALAQGKKYGPGVSDTEIKIGNVIPYSGPASGYSTIGKAGAAYFRKINAEGGINGRKIKFISYDDAYSPPKAVEQTRKLVESDEVAVIYQPLGTASPSAIMRYTNGKKIPLLFIGSGARKFNDPQHFPFVMGWQPNFETEASIYARYILQEHPNAKVGVLYQNDDLGKDLLAGLRKGLGSKADAMIVAAVSYETSDPTIDSQVVRIKSSGADVFVSFTAPKFAAQAIRRIAELNWKPVQISFQSAASVGSVLKPAGLDNSTGIITASYLKDPSDPAWKDDPAVAEFMTFVKEYFPEGDAFDLATVYGYASAQTLVSVLKNCGDDLTGENIMKNAASIKALRLDVLLPGITLNTSPTDYLPIKQMQLIRFNGTKFERFGPIQAGAE